MMFATFKAERFIEANKLYSVEYCGVDNDSCTYRLSDGSTWTFSRKEAAEIGMPRWAHLEVA